MTTDPQKTPETADSDDMVTIPITVPRKTAQEINRVARNAVRTTTRKGRHRYSSSGTPNKAALWTATSNYCLRECMAGSRDARRNCQSTTCPLHEFRMGPRGWVKPGGKDV